MSFRLVDKVLRVDAIEAPIAPPIKAVLTGLARHANDDGTQARPSVDTLSRSTGLRRRAVQKALRELEHLHLIAVVTQATRYTPTVYSIDVRALDRLPKIRGDRPSPLRGAQGTPLSGARHTPQGRTERHAGVHEMTDRGALRTPDSIHDSIHDSIPHSEAGVSEDFFEAFWKAYPKQSGEAEARKEWAALNPSAGLLAEMLRAIATQGRWPQWTKDRGRFIPEPSRWLSGKRWKDAPAKVDEGPRGGGML